MLYNPKWEAKTTQDVPSVAGLITWLETKNPDEEYDYWNCGGKCLFGQYLNEIGWKWNRHCQGKGWEWWNNNSDLHGISCGDVTTFGAALKRAREFAR